MFGIAVELLTGRYTATKFNDRSRAEWPPHPARLFSAMVATWADNEEPDSAEREALHWLETQSPPEICCGREGHRDVVTHFVAVNDVTALTRDVSRTYTATAEASQALQAAREANDDTAVSRALATLTKAEVKAAADAARAGMPTGHESRSMAASVLQVLPDRRGKQGRTYPTVLPEQSTVCFTWPHAVAQRQHWEALDKLLSRVGRIGHSSTLVSCRCTSDRPSPTWIPGQGRHGVLVRVPRPGLMDALEQAYKVHRGEEPRTLPAGMITYHQPDETRPVLRTPLLGGDWYVLGIPGRRLPSAMQALAAARSIRGALLAHGAQPSPEILSGHQPSADHSNDRTPPTSRPHLAIVPLLNAGHPYSDGSVFGIALVLPANCTSDERAAVEDAVRSWADAGFELLLPGRSDRPSFRLEDLGIDRADADRSWLDTAVTTRRRTTTRDYWCRPARNWTTVTPIALDRFPGNLRSRDSRSRDRAEAEAAASIARACVFAGLADQPGDVQVGIRLDAPLTGMPAAPTVRAHPGRRQFPGYRTGTGAPRACVHAEIRFPEPVRGPVLVGAGRYLGYGLCLPVGVEERNHDR